MAASIQVNIHNPEVSKVDTFFDSTIPFVVVNLDNDNVKMFFTSIAQVEELRDELDGLLGVMYARQRVVRNSL